MDYIRLFYLILGLLLCLVGFKMQKAAIFVSWFLLGFNLSYGFLNNIIESEKILLVICFTISILAGYLGFKLEKLSIFVAVAYFSYEILGSFIKIDNHVIELIVNIVSSLIVGGVAVYFMKPVMICVTALYGGVLLNENIGHFVMLPSSILSIAVVLIVIMSIIFQFKTNKKS